MFAIEGMVGTRDRVLYIAYHGIDPGKLFFGNAGGPPPVTMLMCAQPASLTAEKQGKPSEITVLFTSTCRLAHFEISLDRKPLTTILW